MTKHFPIPPATGVPLPASRPSQTARDFLALRRSAQKAAITEPGPNGDELHAILTVAARVPDHRRLAPWRFIVLQGGDRADFGQMAAEIQANEAPETSDTALNETRKSLLRAPTVIVVVFSPKDCPKGTPVWEQELSTGALCQNLLLAANAAGWAAVWLTEWLSYSPGIDRLLDLRNGEKIAGFFYIGTSSADPQERMRPSIDELIRHWTPASGG